MLSCGSWALVLCSSKVMPWAFERTPTERGSLFPCLPPADVGQMASQVSLDLKFWMMMPCGSFLLLRLQTIQCQSNMHASEYTMWLLLFLTSWFLKFSNLICQQLLVRFWFGMLHCSCSFWGGRTSMATQRTHRELAPRYAAGKVPVPWGRECHWETRRPWLWSRHRSTCWVVVLVLWSFEAAKLCHERLKERQLNGAHSFHASLLFCWMQLWMQYFRWKMVY